jgi:hypothetical protein
VVEEVGGCSIPPEWAAGEVQGSAPGWSRGAAWGPVVGESCVAVVEVTCSQAWAKALEGLGSGS